VAAGLVWKGRPGAGQFVWAVGCLGTGLWVSTATPKVSLSLPVPQFPTVQHLACGNLVLSGLRDMSCLMLVPGAALEQGFSLMWALLGWCL